MPQVEVDGLSINYDVQGNGEALLLIPYTSADHACYAFQLPSYTEHFSCIALDLPGSGERTEQDEVSKRVRLAAQAQMAPRRRLTRSRSNRAF